MGVGKRPGMYLPLGTASPDILSTFARGDQHVTQESHYVLREGFALAVASFERMLNDLGVAAEAIDHFIPSISAMQVARRLQPILERRYGLRPEVWRMNLTRVGYIGGVTILSVLDEMARSHELQPGQLVCSVAEESSKWMCAGIIFRWNP